MKIVQKGLDLPRVMSLCLVLVVSGAAGLMADTAARDPIQMAQNSRSVVVVVVRESRVHWNTNHTFIVTDYELGVEENLKGAVDSTVLITVPGGTIEGETHHTCVTFSLTPGARYVLFLEEPGRPSLTPVTGVQAGIFEERVGMDGSSTVVPGNGNRAMTDTTGRPLTFREFVSLSREVVRAAETAPKSAPRPTEESLQLPGKAYAFLADGTHSEGARPVSTAPSPEESAQYPIPPGRIVERTLDSSQGVVAESAPAAVRSKVAASVWSHRATPPIVFNQLLPNSPPWSGRDQAQMYFWNLYAGDLFRILQGPTGMWSWGDGLSDIAGFQPDSVMMAAFGMNWGANQLAVTFVRWFDEGPIVESEILLNAGVPWTVDLAAATHGLNPAYGFDDTMLHELGHAWGLQHPWEHQEVWWDSIMNYPPKEKRLAYLRTDDTLAVRTAFGGVSIHDGALGLFTTFHDPSSPPPNSQGNPVYVPNWPVPSAVAPGDSFVLAQWFKLENTGTDPIVDPAIEFYLCPTRMSWTDAIYLATYRPTVTIAPGNVQYFGTPPLTIPVYSRLRAELSPKSASVVPLRDYYIGAFFRDDAAPQLLNKSAWSDWNVTLNVGPGAPPLPAPSAMFTVTNAAYDAADSRYVGHVGFPVTFEAVEFSAGGWLWDFGDGTFASERIATKIYDRPGLYTATLTVNGDGVNTIGSTESSAQIQASYATELLLNAGRFRIEAAWTTADGRSGAGQAVPLTSDTGYFWFFSPENVETVVKVLDGRGLNGNFWVFAGGLTNVQVVISVSDTQTGSVRTYRNPLGVAFAPIQDTRAFANGATGPLDRAVSVEPFSADSGFSGGTVPALRDRNVELAGPCSPDPMTLCLNGNRFRVETTWAKSDGTTGRGHAVSLSGDTGYFWFFGSANVETVIKVLDGTGFNQHFWVFGGGLTNVRVNTTVTDMLTGAVRTYLNPQGRAFQPVQDTSAFPGN